MTQLPTAWNPCCDVGGVCVCVLAAALLPVSPSHQTREHVATPVKLTGFFCNCPKGNNVALPDFRSWLFQRGYCRQISSDLRRAPVHGLV